MKRMHAPSAKIVLHSSGLGVPSPDTVRERARELSRINGHREVTEDDWMQAKREVHGNTHFFNDGSEDEMVQSASERDMIATDSGHRMEKFSDETENAVEELFAEGMDEAAHDQMLQASQMSADEDSEPE